MTKEPERYYDWMLWKMRQEDAKMEVKIDEGLNLDKTGNELYRRELVALSTKVELMQEDMKNLTSDYYKLINRVKELSEENYHLKEQMSDLKK
jgi:hypothetical protein|tara:strand:+ start:138 stop:416 length:279 start_codon:yes stop_codon:yes gene_type:complete